jgi:predicted O-methyltransferase YrrM
MNRETDFHEHVPAERAELFQASDGGSTELEYLGLLAALVRCAKPEMVLETGCYAGLGTMALAHALKSNGLGVLWSIDFSAEALAVTAQRIEQAKLKEHVRLFQGDTLELLRSDAFAGAHFGVAFFDSDLPIRVPECIACLDRGLLRAGDYAVFHDTSRLRTVEGRPDPDTATFWSAFDATLRPRLRAVIEMPLSRGLVLAQV